MSNLALRLANATHKFAVSLNMKISIVSFFLLIATLFFLPSNQNKISKYHNDEPEKNLSSVNPPAARTGAPGESNCTSCHAGTVQSASGIIDVTFSGSANTYIVGQVYTITIGISSATKNGFEMTILDNSNIKAGTFTNGTNTSIISSIGRQYIRQNASIGISSWSFTWTAPAIDMGDLTIYYAFNKSNSASNTAGDIIYLGQLNLTSDVFNTLTKYEDTDLNYSVFYNTIDQVLNLNYQLDDKANVLLNIQDVSGRLIQQIDFGSQSTGSYSEAIALQEAPVSGVYIVSLIVNNDVYNRKISIN